MNKVREKIRSAPSLRVKEGLPLSPNEERYVLAETLTPHIYVVPFTYHITGHIDVPRLSEALHYVCDRHESMREGFEPAADGQFRKYVLEKSDISLLHFERHGASPEEVHELIHDQLFRKPDLSPGSLHTFVLVSTSVDKHVFSISHHHSVCDGHSMRLFGQELFNRYSGIDAVTAATDFSALWDGDWRDSDRYHQALAFWQERLGIVDEIVPVPEDLSLSSGLATERSVRLVLPDELINSSDLAAKALGVSQFTFFYAVCIVLLARMTGENVVCTAFQSNGRRLFEDAANVTGAFSNALVLASRFDEEQTFAGLAQTLKLDIRDAINNEICPYHHVIQATGLHPRFGVNWYPSMPKLIAAGLDISDADVSDRQSDYDMNIRFVRGVDSFEVILFYKPTGVSQGRVLEYGRQLLALAAAFSRDADAVISTIPSHSVAPPGALPDIAAPLPAVASGLLHSAFLDAAAQTPDAIALLHERRQVTYGELAARSLRLARELKRRGVEPGDRVAILAERGPDVICAMLASSRLGATFVVLDGAYPEQRLETLIEISRPSALLHAVGLTDLGDRLASSLKLSITIPDALSEASEAPSPDEAAWLDQADPSSAAYFLFTSGSTGLPKCVAVSHVPLPHFVAWQARTFDLSASDRFTMLSGLSHDPLMRDIFTPLSLGATLLIPEQATIFEPGRLAAWFAELRPTISHLTPTMGQMLTATGKKAPGVPSLRRMFWGGDLLRPDLLTRVSQLAPNAEHINFYGSTETPQAAAYFPFDGGTDWKSVPIGKGSDGFQIFTVDAARRQKGIGEIGEIAVRSNYLSLGYVQAGEIQPAPDDRGIDALGDRTIYYTGDQGFHMPGGEVVLLGRQDDQVKIRGYRVDLSEITSTLLQHPRISAAIALPAGPPDDRKIRVFVVDDIKGDDRTDQLLSYLRDRLPAYMVPQAIEHLERMPLLPNGKVDRKALEARPAVVESGRVASSSSKLNATEAAIAASWSAALGRTDITASSSFVHMGGDSLSYVQIYLATEEIVGVVPEGWQFMTIREIAASQRKARKFWGVVDTSMLVRAISIFLVVCGHLQLFHYSGGATTALFLVSGFIFGGFQLTESFARNSARPVLNLLGRVLFPVALFSYALFTLKFLAGKEPNLSLIFFYGNFVDYSKMIAPYRNGHEFYLWYIHCAMQIFLMTYAAMVLLRQAGAFAMGRFKFALIMFVAACIPRFVLPGFIFEDFFKTGSKPLEMVNYLPTTHWATFLLGGLIASASTQKEKALLVPIVLTYTALTYAFFGSSGWLFVVCFGLMLLYMSRVTVPKLVSRVVFTLSGASLFIYLTHFQARTVFEAVGLPDWPALNVAGALATGILAWVGWQRASTFVMRKLGRRQSFSPEQEPAI